MTDIDVDALTEEAVKRLGELIEAVRAEDNPIFGSTDNVDDLIAGEAAWIAGRAARVEQDVFDRLEAMAADEVAVGDQSHFDNESGESGPEAIARFISAARLARGGSDAN